MDQEYSEEYLKLRREIEKTVRKCIAEINIDEDKFKYHPRNTDETSLDFRYGLYSICQVLIDPSSNSVKEIIIVDDSREYNSGQAKTITMPIEYVSDIEKYKDLILAHLKHYLDLS